MAKTKDSTKAVQSELSRYKFDTSAYIVFEQGVRRDVSTGRLVSHRPSEKSNKQKK